MPDYSFAQMYVQLQTLVLMADSGEHRLVAPGRSHAADSAATVLFS
jgi:hypothetical protein